MISNSLNTKLLPLCLMLFLGFDAGAQAIDTAPIQREIDIRVSSMQIAEQGDAVVTEADMASYLSRIPREHRSGFLRSRDRIGQAIENLMLPRLLTEEARRNGFLDNEALQAKLYQSAVVLIGQEYMDHYFQSQELDDYRPLAREMFLTEPDQFRTPPRVSFTHVLIGPGVERGELGAMRRIFEVYESLSDGANIDELAVEYSDDPAVSDNLGRYEAVDPAELDEAVAHAVALLEPGQISEPVRSQFGWHVIRLDEKLPRRQLEWEEAEQEALEAARTRHMERARERLVQRVRGEELEVDAPAVQQILDQYEVDWRLVPETSAR